MNWLSQEEIKRRAKESPEEALNVSIEGWEQKCEVLEQGGNVSGHYSTGNCGLCERFHQSNGRACPGCVLDDGNAGKSSACCQEFQNFINSPTLTNAQTMLNRLYLERGKRYGQPKKEPCKTEKPKELRHGDYGYRDNKPVIMFKGNDYSTVEQGKHFQAGADMVFSNSMESHTGGYAKLGNIFDDLERNSKDLEEFEYELGGVSMCIRLHGKGISWGRTLAFGAQMQEPNIEKVIKYHQKLGQLIAYAKRQEAKKDDC